MGYAGYVPAKLPPAKATDVQAALWQVDSLDSLEIIGKLLRNIAVSPKVVHCNATGMLQQICNQALIHAIESVRLLQEEKYRKVKLTNNKLKSAIVDTPGAVQAMLAIGWVYEEASTDVLVVPECRQIKMTEVCPQVNRTTCLDYKLLACALWRSLHA